MKSPIPTYGLLAGIVVNVLMFGPIALFGQREDWLRYGEIFGYSAMILTMTATFFAIRRDREQQGGVSSFSRGLGVGVGVSAIASLLFGLATYAFYWIVGDAFVQKMWDHYQTQIRASGADAASVARQLAEMEQMRPLFYSYAFQAVVMFATLFLIGLAISLISAAILRRRAQASPASR
ncbi:DUF4199 domain-containing protein [Dokdonella sp.]|uniref:DUF4199 domain-containing protein n=1 Tax=Dokdonella sp. TaxID=2291710 RepID=UPI001B1D2220|nr:DUF4199 domain-containing protein [Dokdonella sp.]MBO9661372.1 DUF4199 domain-containing protein [Dokdonella sp.]